MRFLTAVVSALLFIGTGPIANALQGGAPPPSPTSVEVFAGVPLSPELSAAVNNIGGVPAGVMVLEMTGAPVQHGVHGLADHDTILLHPALANDYWKLRLTLSHEGLHGRNAGAAGTEIDESTEGPNGSCAHANIHCSALGDVCEAGSSMAQVHPTLDSFYPCDDKGAACDRVARYNAICESANPGGSVPCADCEPNSDCPCAS